MKYLYAMRKKGSLMNTVVAIAIAQALIAKSEHKNLKVLGLEKTSYLLSGPLQLANLSFLMEQRKTLASNIIIKPLNLWKNMTYHHL